jgi:hypothetical protein
MKLQNILSFQQHVDQTSVLKALTFAAEPFPWVVTSALTRQCHAAVAGTSAH